VDSFRLAHPMAGSRVKLQRGPLLAPSGGNCRGCDWLDDAEYSHRVAVIGCDWPDDVEYSHLRAVIGRPP
jgi:hypothetical protein